MWRACERFGIIPPGTYKDWDDNSPWQQAALIAFDQIRTVEKQQDESEIFKALIGRVRV